MGINRRIVDSNNEEALVDATDHALQVKATLASTADLDTIDGVLDAIQALLEGTQLAKIWDGTHTLDIDENSHATAVLFTGGNDEGTFTRGFVPEIPFEKLIAGSIASGSWIEVVSALCPAGHTQYVTDVIVSDGTEGVAGIEFLMRVSRATTKIAGYRIQSGQAAHIRFTTPLIFLTATSCRIYIYQWSGAARTFDVLISGFRTVNAEI